MKHGRPLLSALLLALPTFAIAVEDMSAPDKSGFMWGQMYQSAKHACGTLPEDLEVDFAKAIRLLSEANPEFADTYQEGLKPSKKKPLTVSAEKQEEECNFWQVGMRRHVKLARYWFPGGW